MRRLSYPIHFETPGPFTQRSCFIISLSLTTRTARFINSLSLTARIAVRVVTTFVCLSLGLDSGSTYSKV